MSEIYMRQTGEGVNQLHTRFTPDIGMTDKRKRRYN